ncbi:MAG: SpoIID/LytB domain-containing protein [Planctomycetota bacterium]
MAPFNLPGLKAGLMLSAAALLAGIYSCTDIPAVHREPFMAAGVDGQGEPDIRVLIDNGSQIVVGVRGSFQVQDPESGALIGGNRDGAAPLPVRGLAGRLSWEVLGSAAPASVDIVVTAGGAILVGTEAFFDTVRLAGTKDGVMAINILPMERYLCGVITGELGDGPVEALKAQAVAARTYALYEYKSRASQPYHLRRTAASQVFHSASGYGHTVTRAAAETRGLVLTTGGRLFKAYFSSTCGGTTANIDDVWDCLPQAVYTTVPCGYCDGTKFATWTKSFSKSDLKRLLAKDGFRAGAVQRVEVLPAGRGTSGRVRSVNIFVDDQSYSGLIVVSGLRLRGILGEYNLKSTWFDVTDTGREVVFSGRGYGHGVGLCQVGALAMGEDGLTFIEILNRYYVGADITRLY